MPPRSWTELGYPYQPTLMDFIRVDRGSLLCFTLALGNSLACLCFKISHVVPPPVCLIYDQPRRVHLSILFISPLLEFFAKNKDFQKLKSGIPRLRTIHLSI